MRYGGKYASILRAKPLGGPCAVLPFYSAELAPALGAPQHFLYFLPLPQGQGSFGPTFLPVFLAVKPLFVPPALNTCSRFGAA